MRSQGGADLTHQFMLSSAPRRGRAGRNIETCRDQSHQLMEIYLSLYRTCRCVWWWWWTSYLLDTAGAEGQVLVGVWTGVSSHHCIGCMDVTHCVTVTPEGDDWCCYSAGFNSLTSLVKRLPFCICFQCNTLNLTVFHKTSSMDSSESFSDAHCEILVFLSPPQALGLVSSPEKLFRKSTTVELVCYRRNAC